MVRLKATTANVGFQPAIPLQTGEPLGERSSLYRIRRSQENHQLVRQNGRRWNCRPRHDRCQPPLLTNEMGQRTPAPVARRAGSAVVQRLDLQPYVRVAHPTAGRGTNGCTGVENRNRSQVGRLKTSFGAWRRDNINQTPASKVASEIHWVRERPKCNACSWKRKNSTAKRATEYSTKYNPKVSPAACGRRMCQ